MITKSRDDLRDENEKLKQQNQQKSKNQQQQYLFEIFINKYGCKGEYFLRIFRAIFCFWENLWLPGNRKKFEFRCRFDRKTAPIQKSSKAK